MLGDHTVGGAGGIRRDQGHLLLVLTDQADPTRAGSRLYWETVSSWWTERELHGGGEAREDGEGVLIRQTTLRGGERLQAEGAVGQRGRRESIRGTLGTSLSLIP